MPWQWTGKGVGQTYPGKWHGGKQSGSAVTPKSKSTYSVCTECGHWTFDRRKKDQCINCGQVWSKQSTKKEVENFPTPNSGSGDHADHPLVRVIRNALGKDPSASWLATAFDQAMAIAKVPAPTTSSNENGDEWQKWKESCARVDKLGKKAKAAEHQHSAMATKVANAQKALEEAKQKLLESESAMEAARKEHDEALKIHRSAPAPDSTKQPPEDVQAPEVDSSSMELEPETLITEVPDASQGLSEEETKKLIKQRLATKRQLERLEAQVTVAQKVAKAKEDETAAAKQKEKLDKQAEEIAAAAEAAMQEEKSKNKTEEKGRAGTRE